MIENITFYVFCDRFKALRPNNFSYEGLRALFDYLENYEEETGQKIELDVIALCCDYSEYKNIEEYLNDYPDQREEINGYISELEESATEEEKEESLKQALEDYLNDQTILIKFSDDLNEGFIIRGY